MSPRAWREIEMPLKMFSFTVLFEPAEEGGFTVTVPALPGLVTEGDTIEEAREMAKDAIRCYLESLIKDGEPIPDEDNFRQEKISVPLEVAV
jgi:predicted RNase H-like HicB family nuclease